MTLEYERKGSMINKCLVVLIVLVIFGGIMWFVIYNIHEHHQQDDPMLYKLKQIMKPLHPDIKNLKLYKGNKSYTINKDKIYLCLRDEKGEYYPTNMLVYVLLHEFAHYLNKDDIGHTEKFHKIFEDLIDQAHKHGIYNPSIPPIDGYCMHN